MAINKQGCCWLLLRTGFFAFLLVMLQPSISKLAGYSV
uniref:Uncharacterized protein n=1 Tax=Nelumbo nucifera TaxID=4432 RepID=A0A822YW40_NELNU|nr:TPA_asm: hypothetical protein HUJ06_007398 [Nelumbo nucifera]